MAGSDSEEDYMTMVIEEDTKKETPLQRTARLRQEAEDRARPKSKEELEAEEEARREEGLATALPTSNKGFKMMAKFGFKQGDALGTSENARKEPIRVSVADKADKSGIGLESEKKRKIRELAEETSRNVKRHKDDELDYRTAQRLRIKEEKHARDLENAQRTAERLEERDGDIKDPSQVPLKSVNVLWRCLHRRRLEKLAMKREKRKLKMSSTRRPKFAQVDSEEDEYDKLALSHDTEAPDFATDDAEEEAEFDAFESLPVTEKLQMVADFLRENHNYCTWCGHKYPDANMEGCPGSTEEAHGE